jgi:hypothetical protein
MVSPVILGRGHSLLAGADRTELSLARTRQFRNGNLLLTHEPRAAAGGSGGRPAVLASSEGAGSAG